MLFKQKWVNTEIFQKLTKHGRYLLFTIVMSINEKKHKNKCFLSRNDFEFFTGLKKDSIKEGIENLEENNLITIQKTPGKKNIFELDFGLLEKSPTHLPVAYPTGCQLGENERPLADSHDPTGSQWPVEHKIRKNRKTASKERTEVRPFSAKNGTGGQTGATSTKSHGDIETKKISLKQNIENRLSNFELNFKVLDKSQRQSPRQFLEG